MPKYLIDKRPRPTGEFEIHVEKCPRLPVVEDRLYLGEFTRCQDAIAIGKRYFRNVDGCAYCIPESHSR